MVVLSEKMEGGWRRKKINKGKMIAIFLWLIVRKLLSLYFYTKKTELNHFSLDPNLYF